MIKLAAFDLDNTLAPLGEPISGRDLALLSLLESRGCRVAICSGKPTYYLCGLMRQAGLKEPVLVGENGAVIQFGVSLPPRRYYVTPHSQEADTGIAFLKAEILRALPGMWFQPNEVMLTPFPENKHEFDIIESILEESRGRLRDVEVYRHIDSFDIVPRGITKASGLKQLSGLLGISPNYMAAVGDGVNDYPMFEYAGLSIGVQPADPARSDRHVETVTEALEILLS